MCGSVCETTGLIKVSVQENGIIRFDKTQYILGRVIDDFDNFNTLKDYIKVNDLESDRNIDVVGYIKTLSKRIENKEMANEEKKELALQMLAKMIGDFEEFEETLVLAEGV